MIRYGQEAPEARRPAERRPDQGTCIWRREGADRAGGTEDGACGSKLAAFGGSGGSRQAGKRVRISQKGTSECVPPSTLGFQPRIRPWTTSFWNCADTWKPASGRRPSTWMWACPVQKIDGQNWIGCWRTPNVEGSTCWCAGGWIGLEET